MEFEWERLEHLVQPFAPQPEVFSLNHLKQMAIKTSFLQTGKKLHSNHHFAVLFRRLFFLLFFPGFHILNSCKEGKVCSVLTLSRKGAQSGEG